MEGAGSGDVGKLDEHVERLAYDVIGAAIEVHKALGPGLLESVYEKALAVELTERGIPFVQQAPVNVKYKGESVGDGRVDLMVDDTVVVELKAIEELAPIHTAQVLSYLRASGLRLGLIINFNVPMLRDGIKRVIL